MKSNKFTKVGDKYEKTVTEDQLSAKFDPTRKDVNYFEWFFGAVSYDRNVWDFEPRFLSWEIWTVDDHSFEH